MPGRVISAFRRSDSYPKALLQMLRANGLGCSEGSYEFKVAPVRECRDFVLAAANNGGSTQESESDTQLIPERNSTRSTLAALVEEWLGKTPSGDGANLVLASQEYVPCPASYPTPASQPSSNASARSPSSHNGAATSVDVGDGRRLSFTSDGDASAASGGRSLSSPRPTTSAVQEKKTKLRRKSGRTYNGSLSSKVVHAFAKLKELPEIVEEEWIRNFVYHAFNWVIARNRRTDLERFPLKGRKFNMDAQPFEIPQTWIGVLDKTEQKELLEVCEHYKRATSRRRAREREARVEKLENAKLASKSSRTRTSQITSKSSRTRTSRRKAREREQRNHVEKLEAQTRPNHRARQLHAATADPH